MVTINLSNKKEINTVEILGLPVHQLTMKQVIDLCREHIISRQQLLLGVVNAAKVVNARNNPHLRHSLQEADIVVADGVPIVWLSKFLGKALPERVAGIDLMCELLELADKNNYSVYLLGAKDNVVTKVVEYIQKNHPGVRIAGFRDGYFDKTQEKGIAEKIKQSRPDILFVAISSPRKENFLHRWHEHMLVPVCHGVGGSFDVLAGISKRAPVWMQKSGLEWFYRFSQEPQRMWKRYLITNTKFIALSIEAILKAKLNRLFN